MVHFLYSLTFRSETLLIRNNFHSNMNKNDNRTLGFQKLYSTHTL